MKKIFLPLFCAAALASCSNNDNADNTKHTDTSHIIPGPGTSKEEAIQQIKEMQTASQNANIEVKPIQVEGGWGYDVMMNGKVYVHQPHIPAVSGNQTFKSEADARKAGELVAYKIRNNIMPPSITVEELDSIGVLKK